MNNSNTFWWINGGFYPAATEKISSDVGVASLAPFSSGYFEAKNLYIKGRLGPQNDLYKDM